MQVKAVAKKIVDLFGNNNVNATVVIDDPTIVCYAEDYDYAINIIKNISGTVYMTVNKNIVACAVDGITVAITAGKLHYSDQVISGFACAAMSRSEMHPEYMGERQLIVAVQKMIAERFNNIVGSSECVDDVIVCHVDKLHDAYLAIEDIAVDFVTVEPGRMIAGIVKGIVVGIEYVEPKTWPTDNYLIRSYANQAIAKHGGYPKYDKTIAENVDFVKTLSKSGFFEAEGGPTTDIIVEYEKTPKTISVPVDSTDCMNNLRKLLENNTDSATVHLMIGYIACMSIDIQKTYCAISSVAEHFVKSLNEYVIVGFVDRFIVAIVDCNDHVPALSSVELKAIVMDAISKRGEYKKYVPFKEMADRIPDNSPYIKELAENLMKQPAVKNFIDRLASLTSEERAEILAKEESVKQVEEYLDLKLTAVKVGFGTDERNGYLSCKVDALTDLVKAGIIDSVGQLNDTKYKSIKYLSINGVMVVFAEHDPNVDYRYLDDDMYDAICQAGITIITAADVSTETAEQKEEQTMPKGQYNLFCNVHLAAVEPHQAMLNIFNHTVNVDTGDRLFKAIFKLIESYMRYFNMVSISSLYGQGFVTDPANIPKLYSMSPTGTLLWDRNAIISFPSCHEVTWHSSQYVGEVAKKHNESFLLNIIDTEGRQFKVAIHGAMSSYHGKPFYLMNIFEMLQDNQEPYAGDVYKHLMDYLNK